MSEYKPHPMTTFPFDNSKIDWELIASSVHWYKNNGAQMERAFASLLFEQGISAASGGQFRYVGNEETGVDIRVNGTNVGIEIKSQFKLFPKTSRGKYTLPMGYTSFQSKEKTCDDFDINCDYLILIDKTPERFRVCGITGELMNKLRPFIFTENKSGIYAKFQMDMLTDICGPFESEELDNFVPIEELKDLVVNKMTCLYEERNFNRK